MSCRTTTKIARLLSAGFALSRNDRKIILYGQRLTTLTSADDAADFAPIVDTELAVGDQAKTAVRHRAATRSFRASVAVAGLPEPSRSA
jgi:hypothetical protein